MLCAADVGLDHPAPVGQLRLVQARGFACLLQPGTVHHHDVGLVHLRSMNENGPCGNAQRHKTKAEPQNISERG